MMSRFRVEEYYPIASPGGRFGPEVADSGAKLVDTGQVLADPVDGFGELR